MEKLYKILVDGKSCHGGKLQWSLPRKEEGKWIPGNWHKIKGNLSICNKGLHLTKEPYRWYKWGCTCYLAETKQIYNWRGDKCVCNPARLLEEIPHPKWWLDTIDFVESIPKIKLFKPDLNPKKEWKLFLAPTWDAARDAAWIAARDAAREAAQDAARNIARDAAWDAARKAARKAARDAARNIARDAAWDAAWDAARDAARDAIQDAAWDAIQDATWDAIQDAIEDAARDAALLANIILCQDLNLNKKHIRNIINRWEVWQKGYGLFCDVKGELFVYGKTDCNQPT
uniref:Uncharacterized protein n=2 Tax=viral metagenome TaxID=1070528 RepID=A0A6M3KLK4_9ZZZZ